MHNPLTSQEVGFRSLLEFAAKSRNRKVCGFFVGTSYGGADGGAQAPLVFAPRVPQSSNPSALPPNLEVGRQSFNGTLEAIMANTITSSGGAAAALVFESTTFEVVDQQGQQWLKSGQIAQALGYSDASSINRIYARRASEFTDSMTGSVKLTDPQGELQETRIFSLRGAHLLAMFARTAIAALFRKWVLDILDAQLQVPRIAYSVNPNDTLSAAQAEQLRLIFSKRCNDLSKEAQAKFMTKGWSKMKSHFGCTYRQIPQREFSEAVSLATRHAAEWVVLDAALPPPMAPAGIQRWLTTVNAQGALTVEPVPTDALVVTPDDLPRLIMHDREGLFTAKQVQKIAMHANLAVMGEMVQLKKSTDLETMTKQMRNLGGYDLCELMAQGHMEIGLRNTDAPDAKDMVTGKRPSMH